MKHPIYKRPSRARGFWGKLLLIAFLVLILILPCFLLVSAYEQASGQPASMVILFCIALLWSLFSYGILSIAAMATRWWVHRKGNIHPPNMFDEAMDALERISNGDYNVYVHKEGQYHYSEFADKINKLAKDLSSMEQMRQEFVSNVSHEIQSPLTSISGFATLLKKNDLPPAQRLHYVEVIEAESNRLSTLSDNLLRLSMLDADHAGMDVKSFRLDKQIEDILLMLEPQWSAKEIELEVALEKITFDGDEELLSQVWINLLHNSIKFTPSGGKISVAACQAEDQIVCTLSDTGSGIPEESLVHIFERFYKVDKARERSLGGNGLGLSLAKKIVDLHGGKISVESTVGAGTTFTLILPKQ